MTTTASTLAAELAAIRADLAELRRYARTQPGHVERELPALIGRIERLVLRGDMRIAGNLDAGLAAILACPAVLEGYLAGADWELAVLIGRLEQEQTGR